MFCSVTGVAVVFRRTVRVSKISNLQESSFPFDKTSVNIHYVNARRIVLSSWTAIYVQNTVHRAFWRHMFQFSMSFIHWLPFFWHPSSNLFGISPLDLRVHFQKHRRWTAPPTFNEKTTNTEASLVANANTAKLVEWRRCRKFVQRNGALELIEDLGLGAHALFDQIIDITQDDVLQSVTEYRALSLHLGRSRGWGWKHTQCLKNCLRLRLCSLMILLLCGLRVSTLSLTFKRSGSKTHSRWTASRDRKWVQQASKRSQPHQSSKDANNCWAKVWQFSSVIRKARFLLLQAIVILRRHYQRCLEFFHSESWRFSS